MHLQVEHDWSGIVFRADKEKYMTEKKGNKSSKTTASKVKKAERNLMDKHPYETMSQIQNRYGGGRKKAGSDGTLQDGRGSNH